MLSRTIELKNNYCLYPKKIEDLIIKFEIHFLIYLKFCLQSLWKNLASVFLCVICHSGEGFKSTARRWLQVLGVNAAYE